MENERNETLYPFAPAALKCGNKCMALLNPHLIELKSDNVTEIKIENVHGFCHDFIIEVQHHLEKKCWRIISNYLYYNEKDHSISIPVISPYTTKIDPGESLCHIRFEPIWKIYRELLFNIHVKT